MTVDRWFTFVAVLTIALAAPGPDFAVVLRHGLASTRAGMACAAGVLTGLLTHSCLAIAGLSTVVAAHPGVLAGLRFLGATYLAGLGAAALVAWHRRRLPTADCDPPVVAPASGDEHAYRDGALTNLLNPKALLFFLGVLPQFLTPGGRIAVTTLLLGSTTIAAAALWYALVLATIAPLHQLLTRPITRRRVDGVTGLALLTVAGTVLAR